MTTENIIAVANCAASRTGYFVLGAILQDDMVRVRVSDPHGGCHTLLVDQMRSVWERAGLPPLAVALARAVAHKVWVALEGDAHPSPPATVLSLHPSGLPGDEWCEVAVWYEGWTYRVDVEGSGALHITSEGPIPASVAEAAIAAVLAL